MSRFLTMSEASAHCGGHPSAATLYRLAQAGHLPVRRIGRRVVISERLLDEWIDGIGDVRATVFNEAQPVEAQPGRTVKVPKPDLAETRRALADRLTWLRSDHPEVFQILASNWPSLGSLDALATTLAHVEAVAGVPFPHVEPASPVESAN